MYIKVSGISKTVSRHDLNGVFTFTRPLYGSFECSPDGHLYFYSTLHEMVMAEGLDGQEIVGRLTVDFIEAPLDQESYCKVPSCGSSHCVYAVCSTDAGIDGIEKFFGSPVRCHLRIGRSDETIYLVEFGEAVEIKKAGFMRHAFRFEDYVDLVMKSLEAGETVT